MGAELTLEEAGDLVARGGVVLYPTETVWGIGGQATNPQVVQRVLACKGIDSPRSMPVLAAGVQKAVAAARPEVRSSMRLLADAFWPGGLTLAVPLDEPLLEPMAAADGTVGLRVSANPVATFLAMRAGGFLISSSANPTGLPPPKCASDIDPGLLQRVDGMVGVQFVAGGAPSTLLKWQHGQWVVIRKGAVSIDLLRAVVPVVQEP